MIAALKGMAPREVAGRLILLAVLAVVGIAATINAAGLALATKPTVAMRFASGNALVLSNAAMARAQVDNTAAGRTAAADLAKRAILRDPTAVTALSALGLVSPMPGAARIIAASEALSRRSLPAQLWLIENSVSQNDVDAALKHYDIALRTSRQAPGILFPILVEAVGDNTLLPAIAHRLMLRPEWGPLYLQQLAQSGTALPNVARLFAILGRAKVDTGDAAIAALYARLVAANANDAAWQVYAATRPGATRGAIRPFAILSGSASPFDWAATEPSMAQIDRDALTFEASIEGGTAAHQLLMLTPGRHRLRAAFRDIAVGEAVPYLRLECAKGGAEIARTVLASGMRGLSWDVTVPAGCGSQWLSLILPPTDAPGGTNGTIVRIVAD